MSNLFINGYHRTNDISSPESIAYRGFDLNRAGKNGSNYGEGFYMCRSLTHSMFSGNLNKYGDCLIHSTVSMDGVLILDLPLTVKLFGRVVTLTEQYAQRGIEIDSKLSNGLLGYDKALLKFFSENTDDEEEKEEEYDDEDENTFKTFYVGDASSHVLDSMTRRKLLKASDWNGIAYTGRSDGPCLVMYNTRLVMPDRWVVAKPRSTSNKNKTPNEQAIIISELNWKQLSKREVNKIRNSNAQPRMVRWISMVLKQASINGDINTAYIERKLQVFNKLNMPHKSWLLKDLIDVAKSNPDKAKVVGTVIPLLSKFPKLFNENAAYLFAELNSAFVEAEKNQYYCDEMPKVMAGFINLIENNQKHSDQNLFSSIINKPDLDWLLPPLLDARSAFVKYKFNYIINNLERAVKTAIKSNQPDPALNNFIYRAEDNIFRIRGYLESMFGEDMVDMINNISIKKKNGRHINENLLLLLNAAKQHIAYINESKQKNCEECLNRLEKLFASIFNNKTLPIQIRCYAGKCVIIVNNSNKNKIMAYKPLAQKSKATAVAGNVFDDPDAEPRYI